MFDAPYCWCCGEKEHKNGYGCNNPKCKEYYKLKGAKNTEQLLARAYLAKEKTAMTRKETIDKAWAEFENIRDPTYVDYIRILETAYEEFECILETAEDGEVGTTQLMQSIEAFAKQLMQGTKAFAKQQRTIKGE